MKYCIRLPSTRNYDFVRTGVARLATPVVSRMRPGEHLRGIRLQLGFTVRDVADLSRVLAEKESNDEYFISNSWLNRLENYDHMPSIHTLFSLSSIYGVSFADLLVIFGVDPKKTVDYHLELCVQKTHRIGAESSGTEYTLALEPTFVPALDLNRTNLLTKMVKFWGDLPIEMFHKFNFDGSQYGYIGLEDRTLDPILLPGTFVQIDPAVQRIQSSLTSREYDRPVYFVELREGYACSWCEQVGEDLLLIPHPLSGCKVRRFEYQTEAEIVGRVTALAMRIAEPTAKSSTSIPGNSRH